MGLKKPRNKEFLSYGLLQPFNRENKISVTPGLYMTVYRPTVMWVLVFMFLFLEKGDEGPFPLSQRHTEDHPSRQSNTSEVPCP